MTGPARPNPAAIDEIAAVPELAALRLYRGALLALIGVLLYFLWSVHGSPTTGQTVALAVIAVAAWPALSWAKNRRTWFPAFEISMLSCIAFYAIPLFKGGSELAGFTLDVRAKSSLTTLLYVLCASWAFSRTQRRPRVPLWARESLLPATAMQWMHLGMFFNTLYVYLSFYALVIPYEIEGTLRALFFGVGIMSTFIVARLWGAGALTQFQKAFFVTNLVSYLILSFATLYLIGGISTLLLAIISYTSARRRIPWVAITLTVLVASLLHLGKSKMRLVHWVAGQSSYTTAPVASLTQLPAYYGEWLDYSTAALHAGGDTDEAAPNTLFDRASLIQMICLCVEEVPDQRDYLGGSTYAGIPALFVPRFLWPDKPSSLQANVDIAIYVGLVSTESSQSVSIAFGPIAEAYLNFGYFGVGALGLIIGWFYKRVALASDGAPQFSALGIAMILLTAWSFQAEQIMATWISSLFQACVICIGLPLIYKKYAFRA